MDAIFMQMHNLVLTREVIINAMFPVDRMRELNIIAPSHYGANTALLLRHRTMAPWLHRSIAPSPVMTQRIYISFFISSLQVSISMYVCMYVKLDELNIAIFGLSYFVQALQRHEVCKR